MATAGGDTIVAIQKDGDPAGTHTDVAQIMGDIGVDMGRDASRFKGHGDTIDQVTLDPVISRSPISVTANVLTGNGTHDETTGLEKRFLDGDIFEVRFKGPGYVADTTSDVMMSCGISAFNRLSPEGSGPAQISVTFEPTGAMKINGTVYGSVLS